MTNELDIIIENATMLLDKVTKKQNVEYNNAKSEVVNLQKQLLSASAIGKANLEQAIKNDLKDAELKMFELSSNNQNLERNYLLAYIKENYE